jgi:mono/diheme cytochrome c family protein
MKRVLRWIGLGLAGVIVIAVVTGAVFHQKGTRRLQTRFDVQPLTIPIPTDSSAIERGRHLAGSLALCNACHGDSLSGQILQTEPGMMTLAAPNLTAGRGGSGARYSDADYVRAIRHGVNADGRGLLIMHSNAYNNLSRDDLGAIVAYVKSVPPIDNEVVTEVKLLGRVLVGLGLFDNDALPLISAEVIDHERPFVESPEPGANAEYGKYLMSVTVCAMCHGHDLRGGPPIDPTYPPGPNVAFRAEANGWTEEEFINAMRTGVTPDSRTLNQEWMPWNVFGKLTDEELTALWRHVRALAQGAG